VVSYGDERNYVVLMSRYPALDAEGRLADPVVRVKGSSTPPDPNTSHALLAADASPTPQETSGRWYLQVSRLCAGCSPPFETGPVRSFTLVPSERPALRLPDRIYARFPFIATVSLRRAPAGTAVTVRRPGGAPLTTVRAGTWSRAAVARIRLAPPQCSMATTPRMLWPASRSA
jgi:hypothetical protein